MTERFRVMNHDDYELDYIADAENSFKKVDLYDCCDLLNELHEENEQFKKNVKIILNYIDWDCLEIKECAEANIILHEICGELEL